jgi:glycyl-tRNA synthetase
MTIEDMAIFCKRKGFVYPSAEIYGGIAGFWDFGPLGVELKNNIKHEWWRFHVQARDDMAGIDGSIITHPKVWEASGHVANFSDVYVLCKKCKKPNKIDKNEMKTAKCDCSGEYQILGDLNLMFKINVGPVEGNVSYLRPETAQLIFADFKLVADNARMQLPFGIAQIGKAFRNEISPRDFIFRSREFEQMEIEYFIHPKDMNNCPYINEVLDHEMYILSEDLQLKGKDAHKMTIKKALHETIIKTEWHAYWLATEHKWFISLGANPDNFRIRQHHQAELSHYALDTWDLQYKFPFGWNELQGMANRTDYDLQQHIKFSKTDLSLFDEKSKSRIVPHVVAEPSQGVERAMLVFMFDAYTFDQGRNNVVLKLHPRLAPIKVGVFPLVNKLDADARKVYDLLKHDLYCYYDTGGSIGRRYARQDEIGTPVCVTIDFQTQSDNTVTLRDRDTTKQVRVKIEKLKDELRKIIETSHSIL